MTKRVTMRATANRLHGTVRNACQTRPGAARGDLQASCEESVTEVAAAMREVRERFASDVSNGLSPVLRTSSRLAKLAEDRIEGGAANEPFGGNQCLAVDAGGVGLVSGRHRSILRPSTDPRLLMGDDGVRLVRPSLDAHGPGPGRPPSSAALRLDLIGQR